MHSTTACVLSMLFVFDHGHNIASKYTCMNTYVYVYISVYIHTHIYICTHTYVYSCKYTYIRMYVHMYMDIFTNFYAWKYCLQFAMYLSIYVQCIHTYILIFGYVYACLHM